MKKALIIVSICLIASPLSANASKKKHHKHSADTLSAINAPMKDEAAKPDAKPAPSYLDNVSGSFDLTTNYIFRGISLSADNPAVQGGLTYTFPIGVYFNVWGSSADYAAPGGKRVTTEFDTIAGLQGTVHTDFTYNVNFARYNYPGAPLANYNEVNTLWGYKIFTLGISYSGNYSGYHQPATYINGLLSFDIPPAYLLHIEGINLQVGTGHYSIGKRAGHSYSDYLATITKKISDKYNVALMFTGTNGRAHQRPYDGNQIVGTVNATF